MDKNDKATAFDPAGQAKSLVRAATRASLATIDKSSGHPFASLVLIATAPDNTPVLLLSALAMHAQNLAADRRASLLIEAADAAADPMTGARVTLVGECRQRDDETARARYLARYPSAAAYADFGDFAFYELAVERAHFVAGFGRIVGLRADVMGTRIGDAGMLVAGEADLIADLNATPAERIGQMAGDGGQAPSPDWRVCGVDPDGIDLMAGWRSARVSFPSRATSPQEVLTTWQTLTNPALTDR